MPLSVAFGIVGDWESLARSVVDPALFDIDCVDFETFDLADTDIAVASTLTDVAVLRDRHGAQRHKFLVPDAATTALCHDKRMLNETLAASRFAHLVPPVLDRPPRRLPYVIKPRDAVSGQETAIVRTREEEVFHAHRLRSDRYFCQTYVEACDEYSTHMLVADGELLYHFTNRYWMAPYTVKGDQGKPLAAAFGVTMPAEIITEMTEVLCLIRFEGVCCIDYKIETGRIRLLEINPRCGFSLFRDINRFLHAYGTMLGIKSA